MPSMKRAYRVTEQELFWKGNFGDDYIRRNNSEKIIVNNVALFSRILRRTAKIKSLMEFGANIGLNLRALKRLCPTVKYSAVEINKKACRELKKHVSHVTNESLLNFVPSAKYDFVLVKGVLIHIHPDSLPQVYDLIQKTSQRYVCIVEYYNPVPVEVLYRGHGGRLFKRDFAGEIMDRHHDLELIDYGFVYHRDPQFPQDDINWFLLKKTR